MAFLIKREDFKNTAFTLPDNVYTVDKIQTFIDEFEEKYLRKILGNKLFDLLKADVATNFVPTDPIFLAIYEPIHEDLGTFCKKQLNNDGMKNMLLGFIWWEFMRQDKIKNTNVGQTIAAHETSREVGGVETNLYANYNASVESSRVIQDYICLHKEDYPDFNGQELKIAHWAL